MEIQTVDIDSVIPYAKNPRNNKEAVSKVAASLKEFGFRQPIVVDAEMVVIAGHTRLAASYKIGLKQVPIHIATDLTENQIKAYRIADNRVSQEAKWDEDLLAIELGDLKLDDYDLTLTGFDDNELDALLAEAIEEGLVDEDQVPAEPEQPVSVLGDVWILDQHRVMCGDSTSIDAVDKLMENKKADMVFTDPPYNADYSSRVDKSRRKPWGGIMNDKMTQVAFNDFLIDINSMLWEVIVDGGSIYECIDWKRYPQMANVFADAFNQKAMIIWNKNYFGLGTYYRTKHEIILFGVKGDKLNTWNANHDEMDVWDIKREKVSNYQHPTQKPVELIERALNNSSKAGDVILDVFGGSGSTLIACEKKGRRARLMELDPKYVDVIIKRWQDFTGRKATHAESGKTFDELENVSNNISA